MTEIARITETPTVTEIAGITDQHHIAQGAQADVAGLLQQKQDQHQRAVEDQLPAAQGFPVQHVLHNGEVEHRARIGTDLHFLKECDAHADDDVAYRCHGDAPGHAGLAEKVVVKLLQHGMTSDSDEIPPIITQSDNGCNIIEETIDEFLFLCYTISWSSRPTIHMQYRTEQGG